MSQTSSIRFPLALSSALVGLLLTGCTVGPDFQEPEPWWSPTSWFEGRPPKVQAAASKTGVEGSEAVAEPIDPEWWRLFNDPQLTALEKRLADENLDVRVQTLRLQESRAQLGVTQADRGLQINGNTSYTRERQSPNGVIGLLGGGGSSGGGSGGSSSGSTSTSSPGTGSNGLAGIQGGIPNPIGKKSGNAPAFDLFQYGFDASYELDLWGRQRRNDESAEAQVTASEEGRRDALLSALAELARDYIQLRGYQKQIEITRRNQDLNQQTLKLTQDKAAGGLGNDLDVANAAAQLATTTSQLPNLEAQAEVTINAIALLLGEAPNALTTELAGAKPIPPVPPKVPVGLPSELTRRRPDIRRAEAQLHAATADVGVAVADFFPRVTLSGSAAIQGLQFKNLGDWASRTYSIGPSITLPIFESGRLSRTLELRKAQEQEAAITYQRTVLGALHDVDNALTNYESEQRRRAALERAVAANRRAVGLAQERYNEGLADFLSVLDAERSLLSSELSLNDSTTTISTNLVQLYKALGGGWQSSFPLDQPGGPSPTGEVRAGL